MLVLGDYMHQNLEITQKRKFAFKMATLVFFIQGCSAGVHISPQLKLSSIIPVSAPDAASTTPDLPPVMPAPAPVVGPIPQNSNYLADPVVTGHTLDVCASGCAYALPSQAIAAAIDGDTLLIQPGDYVDCAFLGKNNIILRGVLTANGDRPKIHSKTCGRKGIFVISGANTLLENLELYGAQDTGFGDNNWAGVRFESVVSARNLIIRNCYIHHNDDGLLGNNTSSGSNVVLIESSIFQNNGRAGYAHGMYLGTAVTLFVLRNSKVFSNIDDSLLVKSRAQSSIVECSTVAALNGLSSWALDFPQGGQVTVRHNVIEQGPNTANGNNYFLRFAEENTNNAPHKISLSNNYFVNDFSARGQINLSVAADTSGWLQNTFAGNGGSLATPGYTGVDSFTNFNSRAAAGLTNYTGSLMDLPAQEHCP